MTKVLKKQQKRKQIAKSTCDLFIKKGFVNISISEIAQVAGIGKGTVYEYFSNKEDIVFELMSCLQEDYDPKLNNELQQDITTKEKVIYLFALYLSDDPKVQTQRNIYKEFLAITLNNPSDAIIEYQENMMKKYIDILTNIFQEGIKKKEINKYALEFIPSIFATMDGFFISRKDKGQILKYLDELFELLKYKENTDD
jgi:TetR/AcrR family transcriptional regulator, acrAB operon repressor